MILKTDHAKLHRSHSFSVSIYQHQLSWFRPFFFI